MKTVIKNETVDLPVVIAQLRNSLRQKPALTAAVRSCEIQGLACRISVCRSGEVELQADDLPKKMAERLDAIKALSTLSQNLKLERFNLGLVENL